MNGREMNGKIKGFMVIKNAQKISIFGNFNLKLVSSILHWKEDRITRNWTMVAKTFYT